MYGRVLIPATTAEGAEIQLVGYTYPPDRRTGGVFGMGLFIVVSAVLAAGYAILAHVGWVFLAAFAALVAGVWLLAKAHRSWVARPVRCLHCDLAFAHSLDSDLMSDVEHEVAVPCPRCRTPVIVKQGPPRTIPGLEVAPTDPTPGRGLGVPARSTAADRAVPAGVGSPMRMTRGPTPSETTAPASGRTRPGAPGPRERLKPR